MSQPNGSLVTNRLLLNVINQGAQPLFSGTAGQQGQPQIAVSFVYGTTPGALAPDADKSAPQSGSAWNISGKVSAGQGNDWAVTNPSASGAATDPVWLLTPSPTNSPLIGTGQHAVVQFEFDQIISQTQPGVTLMYVQLSGFKKDDNTLYNDQLFVLAITKEPLPSPGLIRFSSMVSEVSISRSSQQVQFPLQWSMTGVSKVKLSFYSDDIPGLTLPDVHIPYPSPQPALQFGQYALDFQGVAHSGSLLITCSAYDANDNFLNDLQQTVNIDFPPVVTSYTGEIQLDGSLLLQWTTEGATAVTILSNLYASNGQAVISPAPAPPLLNNVYYALTANGPNENSQPVVFSKGKKFAWLDTAVALTGAYGAIVSPDGNYVFATNINDSNLWVVQVNANPPYQLLSETIPVGDTPCALGIAKRRQYLFVLAGQQQTVMSVIDTSKAPSFPILQTVQLDSNFSSDGTFQVSPDERFIFLGDQNSSALTVIQIDSNPPFRILDPIGGVGSNNCGMGLSAAGRYLLVANLGNHAVYVIDIQNAPNFSLVQTFTPESFYPMAMASVPGGEQVFFSNSLAPSQFTVLMLDVSGDPPFQNTQTIPANAESLALSPDGQRLFGVGPNDVKEIDVAGTPPFQIVQTIADQGDTATALAGSYAGDDALYFFLANTNTPNNVGLYVARPSSVSAF